MKIKTLIAFIVAMLLAMPANDAYAQQRKSTTSKRTTTTARRGTSTTKGTSTKTGTTFTAKPLNEESLKNHGYHVIWILDSSTKKHLGKDVGVSGWLYLSEDNDATFKVVGKKVEGTWSVSGTKLTLTFNHLTITLTSPDGGKNLSGFMYNSEKRDKTDFFAYQVANGEIDKELTIQSLKNNTFKALVQLVPPTGPTGAVLFPVVFKPTLNEEGSGGTYKISCDNGIGIGLIKGTFEITDKGITITSSLAGDEKFSDTYYDTRQEFIIELGKKPVDTLGNCTLNLRLFNQ